jgi:hypothetical protein
MAVATIPRVAVKVAEKEVPVAKIPSLSQLESWIHKKT